MCCQPQRGETNVARKVVSPLRGFTTNVTHLIPRLTPWASTCRRSATIQCIPLAPSVRPLLHSSNYARRRTHVSKQPVREIYVPIEEMMSFWKETRTCVAVAQRIRRPPGQSEKTPVEATPRDALILSADYEVTLDNARARSRGLWRSKYWHDGLHALPLRSDRSRRPARVGSTPRWQPRPRGGGTAAHDAFCRGPRQASAPAGHGHLLETNASQQILDFQLPRPLLHACELPSPQRRSQTGASVISRTVDDAAGVTRLGLSPSRAT